MGYKTQIALAKATGIAEINLAAETGKRDAVINKFLEDVKDSLTAEYINRNKEKIANKGDLMDLSLSSANYSDHNYWPGFNINISHLYNLEVIEPFKELLELGKKEGILKKSTNNKSPFLMIRHSERSIGLYIALGDDYEKTIKTYAEFVNNVLSDENKIDLASYAKSPNAVKQK